MSLLLRNKSGLRGWIVNEILNLLLDNSRWRWLRLLARNISHIGTQYDLIDCVVILFCFFLTLLINQGLSMLCMIQGTRGEVLIERWIWTLKAWIGLRSYYRTARYVRILERHTMISLGFSFNYTRVVRFSKRLRIRRCRNHKFCSVIYQICGLKHRNILFVISSSWPISRRLLSHS